MSVVGCSCGSSKCTVRGRWNLRALRRVQEDRTDEEERDDVQRERRRWALREQSRLVDQVSWSPASTHAALQSEREELDLGHAADLPLSLLPSTLNSTLDSCFSL